MREWSAEQIAAAAGARLAAGAPDQPGPERVTIDSRDAGRGALFVGLPGERVDGGRFAGNALAAGAWGVLVDERHAAGIAAGVVLAAPDPLAALQRLATAWRRELGASVIGVTGSTGKTSTKDILLAVLAPHRRTFASRANFNTEIGLPLEILAAPAGTEVLVLEMGMRGAGQIAELARIALPDVGVIVSIGPVHLELLGSLEAIAAAKSELLRALPQDAVAIIPAGEPLLHDYMPDWVTAITFGEGGDLRLQAAEGDRLTLAWHTLDPVRLQHVVFPFRQAHLRRNLLAAVIAAGAVGVVAEGEIAPSLSTGRGQRIALPGGATLIDDCYNANPMSMRAALDDLSSTSAAAGAGRRVAVLGDMLELGPGALEFHAEIGHHADAVGVDLLVAVGPLSEAIADAYSGESYRVADARAAAAVVPELVESGDIVLVKASRGVGLEKVCEALR
jgi:UDP-N-acetylmuramoyl-tripeptide--D-alanyl-D-alanine ligase